MIRYETDGVRATITIDDPERRNALTNHAMAEISGALTDACNDPEIRVIVLTGAGERIFSAGGDLSGGFVDAPLAEHAERGALADLIRGMRRCAKPVVARVNGHALGGGLGLVAASDLAISTRSAVFGTPEIAVGLWPMMITAVLRPLVPGRPLLEMMLLGRRFTAAEAADLGVINRVVDDERLDEAIDELVGDLAAKSPAAIALGKNAFYAVEDMDIDTALDHLHMGLTAIATTADAAEGIAAFMEKREPNWQGR